MKKFFSIITLFVIFSSHLKADEGMWLPLLIKERLVDMKKNGYKLTSEDIYSVNKACIKDAIVHFGSGCTGELISDKGLLLTNHHCGFSQIQSHSSVDHDYLKDGFWAMNLAEELPNKNLTVKFLIKMEDVTGKVLQSYTSDMSEDQRKILIEKNSLQIVKSYTQNTHFEAKVESLYYGNQYIIFVYEAFTDIRLVGAPPSSIGKFGGDTDNWMWPRHTGDFSMFRIYAGKDNKPADYSKDNVPYKPKKYFSISTKGVKEGDFTFVYGYPGKTQQYLYSGAVSYISDISNPRKINLRTKRLNIQNEEMLKSQKVRIQYASKNASVSNSWKKWQGEMNGIKRLKAVEKKIEFENAFNSWAKGKTEYEGIIDKFKGLYSEILPYAFVNDYQNEAINSNEIIKFSSTIYPICKKSNINSIEKDRAAIKALFEDFIKDYYLPIDKKTFIALLNDYNDNILNEFKPEYFKELLDRFNSIESIADYLFDQSAFTSKEKTEEILNDSLFVSKLFNDPAMIFFIAFNDNYSKKIKPKYDSLNNEISILYRTYMKGQMEFDTTRSFYPDANSTLRVAYGNIKGYSPKDAVFYKHFSTLEGIIEKDNPEIYDYDIPQKLRDVYSAKNFGKWAVNGTIPVCFIATNHTSGGNSGSPVIDSNGNLIGLNFDRAWEGTMSDIVYDPSVCRNIALDIRYVLFVIDKVANASHLIKEMDLKK